MAFISDNEKEWISKLDDAIELCYKRHKPYFLPFLSEGRQYITEKYLKSVCFDNYILFGGYENSERKMLGLFYGDKNLEFFPLSAIEFTFRKCDKLTHRDFLGALMSLGIERETVGDILIDNGRCVVFVKSELTDYISSQIFKVGNVGVKIKDADLSSLPKGGEKAEITYIVSSLRIDNIVAAICKCSRDKSNSVITSGNVCVNYSEVKNTSCKLKDGDVFTIKGKGKFVFDSVLGKTGKGRLKIKILHFI